MADTPKDLPTQSEPTGLNWLEEVKLDAKHNYLKRLREQEADKEYEAEKAQLKAKKQ